MQALTTWHGNVAPVLASGKMAERRRATQKLATAAANKTKPARASSMYLKQTCAAHAAAANCKPRELALPMVSTNRGALRLRDIDSSDMPDIAHQRMLER